MASGAFDHQWRVLVKSSPAAIWPFVADTRRFGRDLGLPTLRLMRQMPALPAARQHLSSSFAGREFHWQQDPFQWAWPRELCVAGVCVRGPIARVSVRMDIEPAAGGTGVTVSVGVQTRGLVGRWLRHRYTARLARVIGKVLSRYDQLAQINDRLSVTDVSQVRFTAGGEERLGSARQALAAQGVSLAIVDRMRGLIEVGDDLALARLRPFELADAWDLDRRAVIEAFLLASRLGLFELRWDVLCPLCRRVCQSLPSLLQAGAAGLCPDCRHQFPVGLDHGIEVAFRTAAAIRTMESGIDCPGGPWQTPHIVLQKLLAPAQREETVINLEPGRYRVRVIGQAEGLEVSVAATRPAGGQAKLASASAAAVEPRYQSVVEGRPDSSPATGEPTSAELTVEMRDNGCQLSSRSLSQSPRITFANASREERLIALERLAWDAQIASAAEVCILQRFREVYPQESVGMGQRLPAGDLAVLFTDVVGFDEICRRKGDVAAIGLLGRQIDVLRGAVLAESGSIVKVMADRAMCVFEHPLQALRAALIAQHALAGGVAGETLLLKAGLHFGPCVAAAMNDRLDFVGSAVNVASGVADLSSGRDVVVTDAVRDDPLVELFLSHPTMLEVSDLPPGFRCERFEVEMKGGRMTRWRIAREGEQGG